MNYKVLLTTSGLGSRLGRITEFTNKSLVRVGEKAAISHIIDSYPVDTEFIVTLGYFGNLVKQYLSLAHPKGNFSYVEIEKYKGEGSSLLYSMVKAEEYLQTPFIFHACDTLSLDKPSLPDHNWVAGKKSPSSDTSGYASFTVNGGTVVNMHEKGAINFDFIHIGIVGIFDYEDFWREANKLLDQRPLDSTLGDVSVLKSVVRRVKFSYKNFNSWFDVGDVKGLMKANKKLSNDAFHVLDKLEESIYKLDNSFIKFFSNPVLVKNRVSRVKYLNGTTPKITGSTENFYKYEAVQGKLFSDEATRVSFINLLNWAKLNLWQAVQGKNKEEFKKTCYSFYYEKTLVRIQKLFDKKHLTDSENLINGEATPKIYDLINRIDFNKLTNALPTNFHGDFILDNIIFSPTDGFKLIDWRQDFSGDIEAGDLYYDLAKLAHNLVVNHGIIDNNLFTVNTDDSVVRININRLQSLVECEAIYWQWLDKNGYDVEKVQILRALIWLNMSPLHHNPFDLFLFYMGKLELTKVLNKSRQYAKK